MYRPIDHEIHMYTYLQAYEYMDADTANVQHWGHSTVLHCQQGSEIWLEVDSSYCYIGYPLVNAYKYNNFGGFAISEM